MLARRVDAVPSDGGFLFEPKWDGFRMLVFRDGDRLFLQSRDEKDMGRYFPELVAAFGRELPERCAVDGEVVIAGSEGLDFEALLQRIHPAESRVARLAEATPASYVAFDLLCSGDEALLGAPFEERRGRLEEALAGAKPPILLTPITPDPGVARDWFERFEGAGLDGVVAKRGTSAYEPGKRSMLKVKHQRTADCVLGGFRWHKGGENESVGSLLLGLYGDDGRLHHVGVAASFTAARRRELVEELAPLREGAAEGHPWSDWIRASESPQRVPGGASRWSRGKDTSWVPLRTERVVEVRYDHMQGTRFRHTAHFARWRPDKAPRECTYEQLEVTPPLELASIFRDSR